MNSHDNDDFGAQIAEIAVLLQSGEVEQAVRSSGEMLADADNRLRIIYNQGGALDEQVILFTESALLHVKALKTAHAPNDAFSCAVSALLTLEVYKVSQTVSPTRKLRLYSFAIASFIDCCDLCGDTDSEVTEDHRGHILSYLASLLYHNYQYAAESALEDQSLSEAYSFLKAIMPSGAIQSPMIKLGSEDVDPAAPGPLLVDILGRAAALGIYC